MFLCLWSFVWLLFSTECALPSTWNWSIGFKFAIRHWFFYPWLIFILGIKIIYFLISIINLISLIISIFLLIFTFCWYCYILFHWFYLLQQIIYFLRETFLSSWFVWKMWLIIILILIISIIVITIKYSSWLTSLSL